MLNQEMDSALQPDGPSAFEHWIADSSAKEPFACHGCVATLPTVSTFLATMRAS
jgi:hypothetical protein